MDRTDQIFVDKLMKEASDLQFKYGRPGEAYVIYQRILRDFPDYHQKAIVQQMMHAIEQEEASLSPYEKAKREAEKNQKAAEAETKRQQLNKMLISSGFSFDGYRIVKYSGYISGDDAVELPYSAIFDTGHNRNSLTQALVEIRKQALIELKEAAFDLGCNAIIGVDFDYITIEHKMPTTSMLNGTTLVSSIVVCVTANGNAVIIEKE